ncbi:hypothetical protein EIP91_010899 [Steccherinum ochraceum]|uniref:Yeast cell wall synthesis Kre9/Knh1-like N-terminal domain-containing protein n=1 Tax=Steccherinum ochraceum TaxID=92696 RepID=A0A4R0RIH6_9APHY|nr:hypothetical protein EIP91_010899 [Steccherinum ochraceum]
MMFPRLAVFAALVGVASADLQITNPDANHWWVANSINTLAWTCQDNTHPQYTVLIANQDPKVLVQPLAIIAIQNNFDCSKTITEQQSSQPAGTGYTILLADPLNSTNVFATSQPFEIKPLGSAYPTGVTPSQPPATSTGSDSAGATPTGQSQGDSQKSGAMGLKATFGSVVAAAAAAIGFALA